MLVSRITSYACYPYTYLLGMYIIRHKTSLMPIRYKRCMSMSMHRPMPNKKPRDGTALGSVGLIANRALGSYIMACRAITRRYGAESTQL